MIGPYHPPLPYQATPTERTQPRSSSLRMLSGVRSRNKLSCGLCLGLIRSRDPSGKKISGIRDTPWANRSGATLARRHRLGLFAEPPSTSYPPLHRPGSQQSPKCLVLGGFLTFSKVKDVPHTPRHLRLRNLTSGTGPGGCFLHR